MLRLCCSTTGVFSSGDNKLEYAPYRTMLDLDPPDHTRLRSLVSKAFYAADSVPSSGRESNRSLGSFWTKWLRKTGLTLSATSRFHLPVIVIAEMLGIPAQDRGPV